MKKQQLIVIPFILLCFTVNAQNFGWQWAKRGGGISSLNSGSDIYSNGLERVVDVAVDSDNNYYYLAEIGGNQVSYDNMTLDTYNEDGDSKDIYVFSTDSEGNFRWDKIIGGGFSDYATSIGIDANNNIYVSGNTINSFDPPAPHFDTDTIKSYPGSVGPDPLNKTAFLIKYDQGGNFQWLREPEGINNAGNAGMLKTVVEPNGKTHSLIAFGSGVHLNGQLEVPDGEFITTVVVYSAAGELQEFFEVDMQPAFSGFYSYQIAYDPNLDRYYISDTQRQSDNELSINGYGADSDEFGFYLAALNSQGEVLWFKKNQFGYSYSNGDIEIDDNGDIYFTGLYNGAPIGNTDPSEQDSFAGYVFVRDEGEEAKGPFLIKLDSGGNLIWGTNAPHYSRFPGQGIALDGDNVYLGLGMLGGSWGDLSVPGPDGQGLVPDPIIMRFDTETGTPQEVIHTPQVSSYQDMIMAIDVDGNGDIVAGGYFGDKLFTGTDNEIENTGGDADFFIAQYHPAENACRAPTDITVEKLSETSVKISWTPRQGETQWQLAYDYQPVDFFDVPFFNPYAGEGNQVSVSGSPEKVLTGLQPDTPYLFFVRSDCGSGNTGSWTAKAYFNIAELSTKAVDKTKIRVFPNPTSGILNLEGKKGIKSFQLYDLQGRAVKSGQLKKQKIDLSNLDSGIYLLSLKTQNGRTQTFKVVKR
jgi:hypothetical protein